MSGLLGQIALASMEDDRPVLNEVADHDGVGDVVGQSAVAAVGDCPFAQLRERHELALQFDQDHDSRQPRWPLKGWGAG